MMLKENILTRGGKDSFFIDISLLQNFMDPKKIFVIYATIVTQDDIDNVKSSFFMNSKNLVLRFDIKDDEILIRVTRKRRTLFGNYFEPVIEQRIFNDISIVLTKEDKPIDNDNTINAYFNVVLGKMTELEDEGYVVLGL